MKRKSAAARAAEILEGLHLGDAQECKDLAAELRNEGRELARMRRDYDDLVKWVEILVEDWPRDRKPYDVAPAVVSALRARIARIEKENK